MVPTAPLSAPLRRQLDAQFAAAFGCAPDRYFSAPGRTEIGGNHTDHQGGRVLAAAVELDTVAAVRENGTDRIRVLSQGYPMCTVELSGLEPRPAERNTTIALIRGVAARFRELGCPVRGFDACCMSTVLPGSGLSSSAAFEVLIGTVCNALFGGGFTPAQVAQIGQYAENVYFGKPCGLMDQTASAVGGLVAIDFQGGEHPVIRSVEFDFESCGYALCIIDTRASHADLTEEYAAIPAEMGTVARQLGQNVLGRVDPRAFYGKLPQLRQVCTDRAVLRSLHFFRENDRVTAQVAALEAGDFQRFLALVEESGLSSWLYLQNVTPAGAVAHQAVAVALALCRQLLQGRGACRVHGGGFAGTVQAFVPEELVEGFRAEIDRVLGVGACQVLRIRQTGGVELVGQKERSV